jgi:hypothetical protein
MKGFCSLQRFLLFSGFSSRNRFEFRWGYFSSAWGALFVGGPVSISKFWGAHDDLFQGVGPRGNLNLVLSVSPEPENAITIDFTRKQVTPPEPRDRSSKVAAAKPVHGPWAGRSDGRKSRGEIADFRFQCSNRVG